MANAVDRERLVPDAGNHPAWFFIPRGQFCACRTAGYNEMAAHGEVIAVGRNSTYENDQHPTRV
jgi:hypothetical protein